MSLTAYRRKIKIAVLAIVLTVAAFLLTIIVFQPGPTAGLENDAVRLRRAYARPANQWPAPWIDADVAFIELGNMPSSRPPDAALQRQIALGAALFHDPILSIGRDLACATCHNEQHGWSNGATVSRGHDGVRGRRNPPSLYDVARRPYLARDGRETSLAAQSLLPLTVSDEMANPDIASVLDRLRSTPSYIDRFKNAYGSSRISADNLAGALVAFQTHLEAVTRFDRFAAGEYAALTDEEMRGLHLFRTKARCANCHFGPMLTDNGFHNLKISSFGEPAEDLGRYTVTGVAGDAGRFLTPSLRHVGLTAPYMHNGLFPSLEGVVNLYDRGGGEVWARNSAEAAAPLYPYAARLDPHIRPLGLSPDEKAALVAFLHTL